MNTAENEALRNAVNEIDGNLMQVELKLMARMLPMVDANDLHAVVREVRGLAAIVREILDEGRKGE